MGVMNALSQGPTADTRLKQDRDQVRPPFHDSTLKRRVPPVVAGIQGLRVESLQEKPKRVDMPASDSEVQQADRLW